MLASVRAFAVVGSPRAHNSAPNFRHTTGVSATPLIHKTSIGEDIQFAHYIKKVELFISCLVYLLPQIFFGKKLVFPTFLVLWRDG